MVAGGARFTVGTGPGTSDRGGRAVGPCAPGTSVAIGLPPLEQGFPRQLENGTSTARGGIDPVRPTFPVAPSRGTFVIFAECTTTAAVPVVLTGPLPTAAGPRTTIGSAEQATVPAGLAVSTAYGTTEQRVAFNQALTSHFLRSATPSGTDGGLELLVPQADPDNSPDRTCPTC